MIPANPSNRIESNAIGRLDGAVNSLMRRYRRQLYTRVLLDALFWGLGVSALVVLAIRVTGPPIAVLPAVVLIVILALIMGATVARWRQPDKLAVAIVADQKLNLKQRLSTAWEYRVLQPDSDITRALAVQVLGRRHPTVAGVFPIELNLWGMLVPLALALLILAGTIDLQRLVRLPAVETDQLLIDEGARLNAFARGLKSRAERQGIPRSLNVADRLQRLGSHMESGTLPRGQALEQLQKMDREIASQRVTALQESADTAASAQDNPSARQNPATRPGIQGLGLAGLRDRLAAGALLSDDLQALQQAANSLAGLGVSGRQMRQALAQYAAGESRGLKQILQTLSSANQNLRDASMLSEAQAAVSRASDNLDGSGLGEADGSLQAEDASGMQIGQGVAGSYGLGETAGQTNTEGAGWNKNVAPFELLGADVPTSSALTDDTRVTLRPGSQKGQGGSLKSEIWALPKSGTPEVSSVALDVKFEAQMEAVLAKESYPLHRKELVRRYFLNLSTGARESATRGE